MKKFFGIILLLFVVLLASAQSVTPRFGSGLKNQDNTGRVITYNVATSTDAVGADSLSIKTNASETIYKIAMTDSLYLKTPVVTSANYCDKLTLILTSTTGTPKLKIATGGSWVSSGTATLSTGLKGIITFVFDGTKWVESGRSIH